MAVTKQYPALKRDEDVMLGSGWLFLGPAKTEYDDEVLENAGCLTGTATFSPRFEKATLQAGSPMLPIKVEPTAISAQLKVTFVELGFLSFLKYVGMGTRTTAVADAAVAVTSEAVTLYGTFFHPLQGYDITAASVTVNTTDATPVEKTEGVDYEIDYDNGMIRRLSTGTLTDGQDITIDYTWSRPAYEKLTFGSELTSNWYPLKFLIPKPDGYRYSLKVWKANPVEISDIPFDPADFTKFDVTFAALADRTKSPDEMLFSMEKEASVIYT
jgi:hypothetical protein